jgi:broad specificity phosphatase PhoE
MTNHMNDERACNMTLLIAAELLREAEDALHNASVEFITHEHLFKQPYRDAPDRCPWDRTEIVAERTFDASVRLKSALTAFPEAPEEPAICGVCHKPIGEHEFRVAMEHLLGLTVDESRDLAHRMFEGWS